MIDNKNLLFYILEIADNALILGHRASEWCGHGPVLEQDIAITNIALDHLGLARNTFQYAAEIINQMNADEKKILFKGVQINELLNTATLIQEDDLPFLRDAWDFRNVLLVEQPNIDWAYTVVRSFFYDHFMVLFLEKLKNCTDTRLAAIAEKSLKEALYHKKWSSEWMIRLGDGTEESNRRIKEALKNRWEYVGELFEDSEAAIAMHQQLNVPLASELKEEWYQNIKSICSASTLELPSMEVWMQRGGKKGIHTEHFGFILSELQFMQRAYPGMNW